MVVSRESFRTTLSPIAVKRLIKSRLILSYFFNEIAIISCVRHRNLIKLKGCCLSGDQRILVYKYVENNNLAQALWGIHIYIYIY